jgi:hypothetical protein
VSPDSDPTGPVDPQLVEYVVVVVPAEPAIEVVLDAVDRIAAGGRTTVLDVAVVAHGPRGAVNVAEAPDASHRPALRATRFGVLSERDLALIGAAVPPGAFGVVAVVEDDWARPLAVAAASTGGYLAGGERIPAARLTAVLPELRTSGRGAV